MKNQGGVPVKERRFAAYFVEGSATGTNKGAVEVAANTLVTVSFTTNDLKSFFAQQMVYKATSSSILVQVRVKTRNIFNSMVHMELIAGNGLYVGGPIKWPVQLKFGPRETVQVDLRDFSNSTNYVYFGFTGYEE